MNMTTSLTDSSTVAAGEVRVVFGRLRRRLREVATSDELSPSQASVLSRLGKGEASTASALATLEGVRPQSMAATLGSLEQLGLLIRRPDPSDGRRQLVTLTETGRERDSGNRAARAEWLAGVLAERLTEEERQTVIAAMSLLDRLVAP